MSRRFLRIISFVMSFVLLIGMVPISAFAMDPPAIQEAHSEEYSFEDIIGDGTYIQEGVTPEGKPGNPMIRILSEGGNKMDTAYLTISLDKYGKTISATDTNSNEVSVLEYTQWQMSARYVRIHEGKVVEDKDVTKECTWSSSDSTGDTLEVTKGGLVTVYYAADQPKTISASYEGQIAVYDGNSLQVVDKTFVANLTFHVEELEIEPNHQEALRSLAFTYLANYEWKEMLNNEGEALAGWIFDKQTSLLLDGKMSPIENYLISYANNVNGYSNSARIAHFISAVAGEYYIEKVISSSNSKIRAILFSDGLQGYLAYAFSDTEADAGMADAFAAQEKNGSRRFEALASASYKNDEKHFQAGKALYDQVVGSSDKIKVVGQYYGGTVAKYVSYVTGCKSITFDSPSPIQYVFRYNFEEFSSNYSVYKQLNYNSITVWNTSAMYKAEPVYVINREMGSSVRYLKYDRLDEQISLSMSSWYKDEQVRKEQMLWNRRTYLGNDKEDHYDDTGAIALKINESIVFGGGDDDTLKIKFAQMNALDPIKSILDWWDFLAKDIKGMSKKKAIIRTAAKLKGVPDSLLDVALLANHSIIGANVVSGGPGEDTITGSIWNNIFCYAPGDGNDTYVIRGLLNKFYLVGYGDELVILRYEYLEELNCMVVTVNDSDTFTIDFSNVEWKDVAFYKGSPFDELPEPLLPISTKSNIASAPTKVDYSQYACPVDIQILDASGQVVLELLDGQETSVETEYGLFGVSLEEDEYVKTAILFDDRYHVQARGTGNGEMKVTRIQWSSEEDDSHYCAVENIPVTKGAVYHASDDLETCILEVDVDANGTIDDTITYDTTVAFAEKSMQMSYGTQKQLTPEITSSSTDTECFWISTDDTVVTVDDAGNLTATGFGEAEIYAMVADGSGAFDSCKVTVPEETLSAQNFVVTGLEPNYEYTGEAIDVQLEVSYGCFPLLQDVHYTAEFSELIEPGKATLTITGINDYSGTQTLNYEILEPEVPDTVEEKVDWVAAECRKAGIAGQWEIALWLHDWLVYNATYDYTYTYYHPNGVLLAGTGVCQSYAEAYALLLDEFSIENQVLSAPEMDHAWNLVKIDGEWCHIDCTWDDPGTGGAENHTYFGMNDVLMKRDHVWNTSAYPVSTSKKNYYLLRTNANVVESTQELEDFLGRMAEAQTESFECYYIGEDGDFSIFDAFRVWFNTNNWKYGLTGYSIEGSRFMLKISLSYSEPWDPPADITEPVDCPNFTMRGPDGVYPLKKYSQNGMVLIFGRETCGNTQALLYDMHPEVEELKEKGIQVLVSLDGTNVPADYESIKQEYPNFEYTYYDYSLFYKLLDAVSVSGSIIYPAVFIINGNGKIISYSTGYVSDFDALMESILKTESERPLPDPDPVDENYYGTLFNYTGDKVALAKYIGEQLEEHNPEIMARDGTWVDNGEEWDSYPLGNAMMDALDPYRFDPRYEIPYGWSYYLNSPIVVVYIGYPEHVEHIPQTVPGKAPTCTETGWTDGSICAVCGITLTEQQIIPAAGHTPLEHTDCTAPVNCAVCGIELEAVLGHDYVPTVVEPGCETGGYTVYICSRCADSYQDQPVAALGHKFGAWIVTVEATCTSDGVEARTCTNCGEEETRPLEAPGHSPAAPERENETEATCSEDGSYDLVVRCAECTEVLSAETIRVPATGHSYDLAVVLPTCTERGYTVYTCHCGESYVGDFEDAVGHKEAATAGKSATCTEPGLTEGCSCENCGKVFSRQEKIPAPGHSWNEGEILSVATIHSDGVCLYLCLSCGEEKMEILPALEHIHTYTESVTEPGCDSSGYTTYSCLCGDSYTDDYVAATGHSPVTLPATAATCTATGLTEGSYCTICGNVLAEQKEVPALPHTWDEGVTTVEPTEEEPGQKRYTCTICGSMMIVSIPELTHVHEYFAEEVVEPTCTEQGYTTWLCYCGEYYLDDYTDAAGHTEAVDPAVEAGCTEAGWTEGTHCSVCGEILREQEQIRPLNHEWETEGLLAEPAMYSAGLISYACTRCGETKTERIPAPEHIHQYLSEVTEPDCENQGYTTFRCECGEDYIDDLIDAWNHKYSQKQVISEATCTEDGEETYVCENCGGSTTVILPKTGHLFAEQDGSLVCEKCGVLFNVSLSQEYLTLVEGKTVRMNLTLTPEEYSSGIRWHTDNTDVIEVDETGLVTAVGAGTAYVIVTVENGELILSSRCRIDVTEKTALDGVQLSTTKATTELYSTDYADLEILLKLPQNYTLSEQEDVKDNGIAIDSARFTDDTMAELFSISVLDDRRIQIVPTEEALERAQANAKSVASKYTGTITVTVQGQEYETGKLTLMVKQTKPKVKATIAAFNSFYTGQSQQITVTGCTPAAIYENDAKNTTKTTAIPTWLDLEGDILTLNESAPKKSVSGKAYLLIDTVEWRIPAAVTLSVKNSYMVPGVKLAASSVTVSNLQKSASVELQLLCTNKADALSDLSITDITAPEGYSVENFNAETGTFTLKAANGFKSGKLTLKVTYGDITKSLTLTVKTQAVKLKLSASKVTLNKDLKDTTSVAVTVITGGYGVADPVLTFDDTKLDVRYSDGKLTVSLEDGAEYGKTYPVTLCAYEGAPTVKLSVAVAKQTVAVKSTIKASGTLDVIREETFITVKPTYTNAADVDVDEDAVLKIYTSADKYKEVFAEVQAENGIFVIDNSVISDHTLKYKAQLETDVYENEEPVKSAMISLSVKMGTAKLTVKTSGTTLFSNDKHDRALVWFETKDAALNAVSKVEIKDAKYQDKFEVIDYSNGQFAIGFRGGVPESLIGKTVTLNLNIFIEGNQTEKANTTAKVKLTIVK